MYLFIPLLTVLGCLLICYIIFLIKHKDNHFLSWLEFNPKAGLMKQPLLWLCILIPLALFFAFGFFAWEGYSIEFSASGYNTFLKISKLPLGLLALSLPLSALAIRIHITHQTALQIRVTEFKNKQDEFYAHEKALHDFFNRIPPITPLGFKTSFDFYVDNRLYKKIFPQNNPKTGVTDCNVSFITDLEIQLDETGILIYYINTYSAHVKDLTPIANMLAKISGNIHSICHKLYIDVPSDSVNHKWLQVGGSTHLLHVENVDQLVGQYRYLKKYIVNICSFSHIEPKTVDSRTTHIIEQPMYEMIKRNDLVVEIINKPKNIVYEHVDFEIPSVIHPN